MSIIDNWNYNFVRKASNLDEQELESGRLNNRADGALKKVTSKFYNLSEPGTEIEGKRSFCGSLLNVKRNEDIIPLELKYEMKNMLLGRNYDLMIVSELEALDYNRSFTVRANHNKKAVTFISEPKGDIANLIADKLNMPLITDRVKSLSLVDLRVIYDKDKKKFKIMAHSMRGSSTWCLIPPVFQLIPVEDKDIIDIVELYQLIRYQLSSIS